MNNPQNNIENKLGSLQLSATIEKERANEVRYLALYTDLLRSRINVLRNDTSNHVEADSYTEESRILKKAIAVERKAWASGFVIGCLVFISVRKLPFWATRIIGGEAKLQAMYDAEIAASKLPNANLKRMGSFLFEGTFTFWAGWRAYHATLSMQSNEMYNELASIPLCQGKSHVSDTLCPDFIKLTNDSIPLEFWYNVNDGNADLKNKDTLKAIFTFSQNCTKRKKFESLISNGKDDGVYIPSPGVPPNILEFSSDEIERLLTSLKN